MGARARALRPVLAAEQYLDEYAAQGPEGERQEAAGVQAAAVAGRAHHDGRGLHPKLRRPRPCATEPHRPAGRADTGVEYGQWTLACFLNAIHLIGTPSDFAAGGALH